MHVVCPSGTIFDHYFMPGLRVLVYGAKGRRNGSQELNENGENSVKAYVL
jgi:hypothetical protein